MRVKLLVDLSNPLNNVKSIMEVLCFISEKKSGLYLVFSSVMTILEVLFGVKYYYDYLYFLVIVL